MINAFSENQLLAQTSCGIVATEETLKAVYTVTRVSAFVPLAEVIEDADLLAFMEAGAVGTPCLTSRR